MPPGDSDRPGNATSERPEKRLITLAKQGVTLSNHEPTAKGNAPADAKKTATWQIAQSLEDYGGIAR